MASRAALANGSIVRPIKSGATSGEQLGHKIHKEEDNSVGGLERVDHSCAGSINKRDIDIATNESSIRNDTGTDFAVSNKKADLEINDFKARVR